MGCKVNGYCSDMTRTIFVGEPTEEMKKVYDLVLNNQKFALDQYKDGANARQITKMVESNFKLNGGYDLIHSLGHGVGLEIHELPYMSYRFDTMLRENMVVTDEPGIYIPGKFGVRIEDTVQITKFGCISLTNRKLQRHQRRRHHWSICYGRNKKIGRREKGTPFFSLSKISLIKQF